MTQEQGRTSGYSGESGSGNIVTEQVKQGTQQAVQQTQEVAGHVTESAKQGAVSYVDSQKQTATQGLHSVADALHETGTTLQSKNQAPLGKYANTAGDKVEGFAGYLEQTTVQDLIRDAEDFARQHSSLFLGGAVALGVAAARFIKASSPSSAQSSYGSGQYASSGYRGNRYGSGRSQLGAGTSFASGAPYGDAEMAATPSSLSSASTTGLVDEVELPDATVFNADLATESTDGTTR
jgi:hypothetical protein